MHTVQVENMFTLRSESYSGWTGSTLDFADVKPYVMRFGTPKLSSCMPKFSGCVGLFFKEGSPKLCNKIYLY